MGKRVLSIEDNSANRKIIFDLLNSQGYEVLEATDGKKGLEQAKKEKPDLVLMDIQLPEMDGYQVLKAMRECDSTKKIPVVVLSSYAMPGDRDKGLEAGCNEYLTKPYNFKILLEKIKKYIG